MSWFFNAIYLCFLLVASPWLLWRRVMHGKNRRGWSQKLLGNVEVRKSSDPDKTCIWMHAVSVGEVILLGPIIDRLLATRSDLEIVISTTTETGFDLAQSKFSEHYVFFCPFDFSWAIGRVVDRLRPDMLMLAELELWPNLIRVVHDAGVPVSVVNGRMSENSFRGYYRFRSLLKPILGRIGFVAAQNETYAARFRKLGCDPNNVVVTGSVKFDGVETDRNNARTLQLSRLAGIESNDNVFLAGSTQLEEDLMAARIFKVFAEYDSSLRLILVPRHPERCSALVQQLDWMELSSVRRSEIEEVQSGDVAKAAQVLIVDVIGELGAWWGCADIAYVGGSMGKRGGQNMLEPAAYGAPVSFGPNTENFKAIVAELLANDAAVVVDDESQLKSFVEKALSNSTWAEAIGSRAQKVVLSHVGASQRTADGLCDVLNEAMGSQRSQSARASVRAKKNVA